MKSPLKILTTAAVSGALIAGGIAGAAPAFADTETTVTPTITTSTAAVTVPAITASAPIAINTNAGYYTDISAVIGYNGAVFSIPIYQDSAGNATVDLMAAVSRAVFNYDEPAAGNYSVTFTSTADSGYDFSTDPTTHITYLPASSAPVALTITKLNTKISGFSTKTKKITHGKYLSKKYDTFTVKGAGITKVILQYKKKGGKWKNVNSNTTSESTALSFKDGYKYNQGLKHGKLYPRGTQYFRIVVKASATGTGATSKAFKFVVK